MIDTTPLINRVMLIQTHDPLGWPHFYKIKEIDYFQSADEKWFFKAYCGYEFSLGYEGIKELINRGYALGKHSQYIILPPNEPN